jgi:hypothetical protein
MRACPVCSTPKPEQPVAAEPNPGLQARRNRVGVVYSVLALLSVLGVVASSIEANVFALGIGVVMTLVWGRLAFSAFREESTE